MTYSIPQVGRAGDSDIAVWKKWKSSGSDSDLQELYRVLNPLIQKNVNTYAAAPIPRSALEAEAKKLAYQAFQNFNPNMGVKLSTHVSNYLRKLFRYTGQHQNVARIPEHRLMQIRPYESAKMELESNLNRPATSTEISEHLGWPVKKVELVETSLRKDIAASTGMGDEQANQFNPNVEILNFAYHSLTPEEQLIYDYTLGTNGKQKLTPGKIAQKLHISPSRVSKIRTIIAKKLAGHING